MSKHQPTLWGEAPDPLAGSHRRLVSEANWPWLLILLPERQCVESTVAAKRIQIGVGGPIYRKRDLPRPPDTVKILPEDEENGVPRWVRLAYYDREETDRDSDHP